MINKEKRPMKKTLTRRAFLKSSVAAAAAVSVSQTAQAAQLSTNAHIVVIGAGAGGLAVSHLLNKLLSGHSLTIIDKKMEHHYQPGFTLVASGVYKSPSKVISNNKDHMPDNAKWIQDNVVSFNPDKNQLILSKGDTVSYDFLIIAPGCQLNYQDIEGLDISRIGTNGIGSVYAGPQGAAATWDAIQTFIKEGGKGVFTRPNTDMKCAGAPMKVTNLTEHHAQLINNRQNIQVDYFAHDNTLFSVPAFDQELKKRWQRRNITPHYSHVLSGIDMDARKATFDTPDGSVTADYDFIHVVPPMSAPDAIRKSELAQENYSGWLDVDKYTLQHKTYPNIFGIGDVVGTPIGKTAASAKTQAPIVAYNLTAVIAGKTPYEQWNGYTSCPMILGIGKVLLWEFGYEKVPTPTFPGDPNTERWLWWRMETDLLGPLYTAMINGQLPEFALRG